MKISFIIATFNESKKIFETLSQFKNIYGHDYEIIVSDNCSNDDTTEIIKASFKDVKIIQLEKRKTIAECRNRGALAAKGDILWFIDADVRIVNINDALKKITQCFSGNSECVGIILKLKIYKEEATWADNFWFGTVNAFNFVSNRILKSGSANGDCMIVRRSSFDKIKGFNQSFISSEDHEFFHRLSKEGDIAVFNDYHIEMSPRRIRQDGWVKVLWTWSVSWIRHFIVKYPESKGEWEAKR